MEKALLTERGTNTKETDEASGSTPDFVKKKSHHSQDSWRHDSIVRPLDEEAVDDAALTLEAKSTRYETFMHIKSC